MTSVERDIDRILTLLRNKIREKGFTQLDVQHELSWGRSYISQLLTKQKSLRVEQILLILGVIGVDPGDFYAELYHLAGADAQVRNLDDFSERAGTDVSDRSAAEQIETLRRDYDHVRSNLRGLVQLLVSKDAITLDELNEAVRKAPELDEHALQFG